LAILRGKSRGMTSYPLSADRPLDGILWMLASGLCFVGVTGIVRYLGTDLPAAQSAFIRFAFGVVFLAPALLGLWRSGLPERAGGLFVLRGLVHTAAVVCWFFAMARLPVAEVTAIGYLNPVLVSVFGALLFGEALARRRVGVLIVALLGAVIVLRPGLREVTTGHLAQLAAAVFFAGSYLVAKRLSQFVPAGVVVAVLSACVTVALLPLAVWVWVPVSMWQLGWLAVVAGFATGGHYCMSRAFAAAPLAVTQPVVFLQLVWATLLGAVVFDEGIDPFVILGGAVIIGAVSWLTFREARTAPAVASE
jgi:drug/metabolite transporter (DMT)-like permease